SKSPVQGTVNTTVRSSNDCNDSGLTGHFLENGPSNDCNDSTPTNRFPKDALLAGRREGRSGEAASDAPDHGGSAWRGAIRHFELQTDTGESLKTAALAFLESDLAGQAVELGWTGLELFGVLEHGEAEAVRLRSDAKGIVSLVAVAPWAGTRLDSLT